MSAPLRSCKRPSNLSLGSSDIAPSTAKSLTIMPASPSPQLFRFTAWSRLQRRGPGIDDMNSRAGITMNLASYRHIEHLAVIVRADPVCPSSQGREGARFRQSEGAVSLSSEPVRRGMPAFSCDPAPIRRSVPSPWMDLQWNYRSIGWRRDRPQGRTRIR